MRKLSIIIPTFNRCNYLNNLLHQLFNISHAKFEIQVIVIIDGSTDGTLELMKYNYPKAHLVKGDGSWWYTKSINEGVNYAAKFRPNYILTLNDDLLLDENFFLALENAIIQAPQCSIIGALSLMKESPDLVISSGVKKIVWWKYKLETYYKMFSKIDISSLTGLHTSKVLPGRGMLIPYNVIDSLNGFDLLFPQYHSDFDFCLRAQKLGYEVFVSWDLILYSYVRKTSTGTSFIKTPFNIFIKGFINKNSRISLISNARYLYRHGVKILFPVTFLIFIISSFKAHYFNNKISE